MTDPLYIPFIKVHEGTMSQEEAKQCYVDGITALVKYQMEFYHTLPATWLEVSDEGIAQFKEIIKQHNQPT